MWLHLFPQFFISGITNGSIYALIALGYCLIQNATGLVNFAQGDFVMIGAMLMITLYQGAHLPMPLAFIFATGAVALIGIALERGPIEHSRNRDILSLVMITIGASISFRGTAMLIWGKNARTLTPIGGDTPILFLNAAILPQSLWILTLSLIVLALL